MTFIDKQLYTFKNLYEDAIVSKGASGKTSLIRSSGAINLIHDAVKHELISAGVKSSNIFPPLYASKPELKITGLLKQKDQDICVIPSGIPKVLTDINWGPLAVQNKKDEYGPNFTTRTLIINVRSQMSSLAKNSDTLFERTFAESLNLHLQYPDIVLGEVYLIPLFEYDDEAAKSNKIAFKSRHTNIERYISFFNSINNRVVDAEDYAYERCALLIVDFSKKYPHLFDNTDELKSAGYLPGDFNIEYATLNFHGFAQDILAEYAKRYDVKNILA